MNAPYLPLLLLPFLPLAADGSTPQDTPVAMQAAPASSFPWENTAPQEIIHQSVLSDRVMHETACDWRSALTPIARGLVKDCSTAQEAVLALAAGLPAATGVHYSTERRTPCMNVVETLEEKKVSCTGQTIFLVCALRAVGIPARAVGILTWNHIEGNHTWAEAWFDGGWHMIEYNEKDFNTPWVMENIGMINPREPAQRILAATPQGKYLFLPSYAMDRAVLPAEDVTERYLEQARRWYESDGLPAGTQRIMVDISPRPAASAAVSIEDESGNAVSSDALPTTQDDMRKTARLLLPRNGSYYLRVEGQERRELLPTAAPVQVIRL